MAIPPFGVPPSPWKSDNGGKKLVNEASIQPTSPLTKSPYAIVSDEPTTNLIVNPKFEVNVTDGWNDVLTPTVSRSTAEQWVGAASMELTTNASLEGVESDTMAVDINSKYVFSFWAKGTDGTEELTASIVGDSSGAVNVAFLGREADVITTEWRRFRWFATTNGTDTTLKVQIKANSAGAQTVFIDGVQLEKKNMTDGNFPSAYCDGSLGPGHSWSGTADNSSSSRVAGVHVLAPIEDDAVGGFVQRTDGSLEGKMEFRADYHSFTRYNVDEPFFPYTFTGDMQTKLNDSLSTSSGQSQGLVHIENENDGIAAYITSGVTTDYGAVFDFGSLTSGAGIAVFAPSDLSTMESNSGQFFTFADKSGAFPYSWLVESARLGTPGISNWHKALVVYGKGGMDGVDGSNLTGTVSVTNGSPTVTGSGTAFLSEYRRGDNFQYNNTGSTWQTRTVQSVDSDTQITLTTNASHTVSAKAHRSQGSQWGPGFLRLEGGFSDHHNAAGDYLYTIYPNGPEGQLYVHKGSAIETDAQDITAAVPTEGQGDALVTKKHIDISQTTVSNTTTETTVMTGYTVPALMLGTDKILRITFFGDVVGTAATVGVTWRVKLGGTTILTSNTAQDIESTNVTDFRGTIDVIGTSDQAQFTSIDIKGKQTGAGSAIVYGVNEIGTGSVDCRLDQALTVTAQWDVADAGNTLNLEGFYIELI